MLAGSLTLPPCGSHCRAPGLEAPDRSLLLCFSLGLGKILLLAQLCKGGDSGTMLVLLEGLLCLLPDLPVLYTFLATTLSTGGQVKQNKMLVFNLPNSKAKLEAFNFLRKTVSVNWTISGLCLLL